MARFYTFAIIENDGYDIDQTFDDPKTAIEWAMAGKEVAVLDALSLEYLGHI